MIERIRRWLSASHHAQHAVVTSAHEDYVPTYHVKADDLEIHLPISPTPHFFTMVRCFATSLKLFGGQLAHSRIVVTVGADREPMDLYRALPWSRDFAIDWRWLDRDLFRRSSYYATALERFRQPFRAPVVLLADADVLVAGPLDDLVGETLEDGRFGGLIAHVCPFPPGDGEAWWQRIFSTAGLGTAPLYCQHTGYGFMDDHPARRLCPPYFNLGALIAPASIMTQLGSVIADEMANVDRVPANVLPLPDRGQPGAHALEPSVERTAAPLQLPQRCALRRAVPGRVAHRAVIALPPHRCDR